METIFNFQLNIFNSLKIFLIFHNAQFFPMSERSRARGSFDAVKRTSRRTTETQTKLLMDRAARAQQQCPPENIFQHFFLSSAYRPEREGVLVFCGGEWVNVPRTQHRYILLKTTCFNLSHPTHTHSTKLQPSSHVHSIRQICVCVWV